MLRTIAKQLPIAALALLTAFPAKAQITVIAARNNLSIEQAAAAYLLARAFNLDATFIISTGRRYGVPIYYMGPALRISRACGCPLEDVLILRRRGYSWGVIASRMDCGPDVFYDPGYELIRIPDRVVYQECWEPVLLDNGCSRDEIITWRNRGWNWSRIAAGTAIAVESRRRPHEVFAQYDRSRNWNSVGRTFEPNMRWSYQESHSGIRTAPSSGRVKTAPSSKNNFKYRSSPRVISPAHAPKMHMQPRSMKVKSPHGQGISSHGAKHGAPAQKGSGHGRKGKHGGG
jgi:hypothetical protein